MHITIKDDTTWAERIRRVLEQTELVPEYKSRPILPAKPSRANDHLTLSDAHRLLSVLRDETPSRAVHAECEDVMARLSKIVEG